MMNDPGNIDDNTRRGAQAAIMAAYEGLMEQRRKAIQDRHEADRRVRSVDRGLLDCRAAGRLFGLDITMPEDLRPGGLPVAHHRMQVDTGRYEVRGFAPRVLVTPTTAPAPPATPPVEPKEPTITAEEMLGSELSVGEASIRDLVLDRLKSAGPEGVKAAVIRRYVESVLNRQIHYKTIGMTLYRLSKLTPPMARRNGITWFFVPTSGETKKPGGETPGSETDFFG